MIRKLSGKFFWVFAVSMQLACVEHSKDALHSTNIQVNTASALDYLNDLAERDPKNPEVFYQLGRVHYDEQAYSYALQNTQKAIQIKQDKAEYHYLQGKIHQKLNQPDEAVASLLLAESLGKKNHELYKMIAEEYLRLGESKKAREAIDKLTSMNESAEAFALKADIMLSLGDTTLAVQNYRRALKKDSLLVRPYVALADIDMAKGNVDKASHHVNKLMDMEPGNLDFIERKGEILQMSGKLDSAKVLFRSMADQRQGLMDYYKLSNIYYLLGQYDSAIFNAEQAQQMNRKFLDAQLVIARSLDQIRDYQQAIAAYENILSTDSTFNLAVVELDNLKRKVAYLWRLEQERKARNIAVENMPPPVQKMEIIDN